MSLKETLIDKAGTTWQFKENAHEKSIFIHSRSSRKRLLSEKKKNLVPPAFFVFTECCEDK